jgi:hypothetical protein
MYSKRRLQIVRAIRASIVAIWFISLDPMQKRLVKKGLLLLLGLMIICNFLSELDTKALVRWQANYAKNRTGDLD